MKGMIYIAITDTVWVSYEPEMVQWAASAIPELTVLYLDNHSDALMIKYCQDLLRQAKEIVIFFDCKGYSEVPLGQVSKLPHLIMRHQHIQQIKVMAQGQHAALKKIEDFLGKEVWVQVASVKTAKEQIQAFFSEL